MWSQFTNVTDGRTDGQTTCDRNTALCTKVHRAVKSAAAQKAAAEIPLNSRRSFNMHTLISATYRINSRPLARGFDWFIEAPQPPATHSNCRGPVCKKPNISVKMHKICTKTSHFKWKSPKILWGDDIVPSSDGASSSPDPSPVGGDTPSPPPTPLGA